MSHFGPATNLNYERRPEPAPWIRALESFAIPFICYGADGRRMLISVDAERILAMQDGVQLGRQADRAVAAQIEGPRRSPDVRQFVRTSEIKGAVRGIVLAVYVAGHRGDGITAVVVFQGVMRGDDAAEAMARDAGLTDREAQVASLVAAGYATKEIAARLAISIHTARHHTERVFAKLGVRSRAALAALFHAGKQSRVPVDLEV